MEVILLEKLRHVGSLGDKVKVKSGFARNYLVPQGKAAYATADNLAKFEARRAELEKVAAERLAAANARKDAIEGLKIITIKTKVGEEGKLFGSLGTRDISHAITEAGIAVEKHEIDLPMGLIRQIGEYDITVELHSDVVAVIKLAVVAE